MAENQTEADKWKPGEPVDFEDVVPCSPPKNNVVLTPNEFLLFFANWLEAYRQHYFTDIDGIAQTSLSESQRICFQNELISCQDWFHSILTKQKEPPYIYGWCEPIDINSVLPWNSPIIDAVLKYDAVFTYYKDSPIYHDILEAIDIIARTGNDVRWCEYEFHYHLCFSYFIDASDASRYFSSYTADEKRDLIPSIYNSKSFLTINHYKEAFDILWNCWYKIRHGGTADRLNPIISAINGYCAMEGVKSCPAGLMADITIQSKAEAKLSYPSQQDKIITDREPLAERQRLIYEKLESLHPHEAMTGPQLLDWLSQKHDIELDEKTFRRYMKLLKEKYGVKNKPRTGYYLPKQ